MFRLSKSRERTFYFFTYVFQGSSSRVPRAYAHMHRAHHAYSDTEKDPPRPLRLGNVFQNNHHRHGQSANFVQRSFSYLFLRTRALFGAAKGQLADEEAQGSPQVPTPVAEPAGAP